MTTKAELRRQLSTAHENLEGAWDIILQGHKSEETRNLTLLNQRSELDVAWERVQELQTALAEATDEINHRTVPTEIYDMVVDELRAARDRSEALERALDDLETAANARQAYRPVDTWLEAQEAADRAAEMAKKERWKFCEYKWGEGPEPSKLHRCGERNGHQGKHKCDGYMKAISCDATTENLTTIIPPPGIAYPTHSGFKLVIKRDLYGNITVETLP